MTAEPRENPVKFSKLISVFCPGLSAVQTRRGQETGPGPHPGGEGQVSTDVSVKGVWQDPSGGTLLCGGVGFVNIFLAMGIQSALVDVLHIQRTKRVGQP